MSQKMTSASAAVAMAGASSPVATTGAESGSRSNCFRCAAEGLPKTRIVFESLIMDNLQDNRTRSDTSYDKDVNGTCTCGVELVDGARFCHKCGRPVDGTEPVDLEPTP